MARIAFIGLGQMGAPMAQRLLRAGHAVQVWNRTASKGEALVREGAVAARSPREAAQDAALAITMVSSPDVLRELVLGPDGIAAGLPDGAALVDMSTVGPTIIHALAIAIGSRLEVIDAPVLGSVPQATDGTLQIYFGGDDGAYAKVAQILSTLGTIQRVGPRGAGAALKLAVNSTLGAAMTALGEALAIADALGVDPKIALDALEASPLGVTVRKKRALLESGTYKPNFKVRLAVKDLALVCEEARAAGVLLKLAPAAREWFTEADGAGLSELDYSAVIAQVRQKPAHG